MLNMKNGPELSLVIFNSSNRTSSPCGVWVRVCVCVCVCVCVHVCMCASECVVCNELVMKLKTTKRRKIKGSFSHLAGLEPATFRLTAERANRLRHKCFAPYWCTQWLIVQSLSTVMQPCPQGTTSGVSILHAFLGFSIRPGESSACKLRIGSGDEANYCHHNNGHHN